MLLASLWRRPHGIQEKQNGTQGVPCLPWAPFHTASGPPGSVGLATAAIFAPPVTGRYWIAAFRKGEGSLWLASEASADGFDFPQSFRLGWPCGQAGNLHLVVSAAAETHTLISHIQLSVTPVTHRTGVILATRPALVKHQFTPSRATKVGTIPYPGGKLAEWLSSVQSPNPRLGVGQGEAPQFAGWRRPPGLCRPCAIRAPKECHLLY